MDKLWFDGKCSSDFGIYISGDSVFNAPVRDIKTVEIEGRNGSLIIDNGRYKNIVVNYPVFIRQKFRTNANSVRQWLCSQIGYKRLEDTYNPEYFRLGRFSTPLNFDVHFLKSSETNLSFDCKPQRFLKSGEYSFKMNKSGVIYNPTSFNALPIITIFGNGTGVLNVNGTIVQVKSLDDYLILDSETQNAYKDTANKNNTINAEQFPFFTPDENIITISGNITGLEITPRWWTL